MSTTIVMYVAIYLGGLVFTLGSILRAVQYARTPYHLRWELYPVPHEEAQRAPRTVAPISRCWIGGPRPPISTSGAK